ncbi:STAS domain-containing protein [Actinomadura chokoriensis]|jgi:anti-anti-sigma factor|uniref:STAS domain-containing protein n=1 Tax=Actinomadura chokoriensis TaxID=454156 RepID=UPI0031F840EC
MGVHATWQSASAQLTTSVEHVPGTTRVAAAGELDIATATDFGIELAHVIDEHGPDVLIDASSLTFCDARGLAAIVAADGLARHRGGSVTLTGVRPQMARILRITRLDKRLRPVTAAAG